MLRALSALMLGFACALLLFFVLTRPSGRIVSQWENAQPDRTYLSVVQSGLDWSGFPFRVAPRHLICVGRDPGAAYGHFLEFSFYPLTSDGLANIESEILNSQVEWAPEGVRFTSPAGHALFIPRRWYEGGR